MLQCVTRVSTTHQCFGLYRGADKSLARPTSQCILFDGENILFDASLVLYIYIYTHTHTHICMCIYIYSNNIPPIMIINRIYEKKNLLCRSLFPSWSG